MPCASIPRISLDQVILLFHHHRVISGYDVTLFMGSNLFSFSFPAILSLSLSLSLNTRLSSADPSDLSSHLPLCGIMQFAGIDWRIILMRSVDGYMTKRNKNWRGGRWLRKDKSSLCLLGWVIVTCYGGWLSLAFTCVINLIIRSVQLQSRMFRVNPTKTSTFLYSPLFSYHFSTAIIYSFHWSLHSCPPTGIIFECITSHLDTVSGF